MIVNQCGEMPKISVEQRVLKILVTAMKEKGIATVYEIILCPGGWVPWWIFSSITWCKSTQGLRRLRELRADPEITAKYIFEKKHDGQKYYYRIIPRQETVQGSLAFAEAVL